MLPPARRCRSSPPRTARHAPCFYSSPLDAARSKDGAGPRRLCFARWPLAQLPSPAWARSPVGPPERRAEAGCPSPVATVEAADAARFVPPVFSSSFSGARAKRKRLRIDGLHSPTTQCRYAAQPAKKERKPCGLNDRTACLVRRLAPAERRSFSRLGRCRAFPTSGFLAPVSSNACTPHRMRSRFAR